MRKKIMKLEKHKNYVYLIIFIDEINVKGGFICMAKGLDKITVKNVFKNANEGKIKEIYTKKWIEIINRLEKIKYMKLK